MMRLLVIFSVTLCAQAGVLWVDVPMPEYQIADNAISIEDAAYVNVPGAPNLPCKKLTIALPPGALFEYAKFYGTREEITELAVSPAQPPLPLMDDGALAQVWQLYEHQKEIFYSSDELYPQDYGTVLSKGGMRKYTLVDLVCYPFAYRPVSQELYYSSNITIEIHYRMPDPESERAQFWQNLIDDVTFDEIAQEMIYNWDDCQMWYRTDTPKRTNGYTIIIPAALQNSVDNLVTCRQNQGYDVNVITVEYIEANVAGNDLQQKVRNYLRTNMVDIEYVLFVGFYTDLPWRNMVPFNNDPDSPYNHPDYSPIPSDLYYAELTDPDSLSWNSDGDSYYGEVYTAGFQPIGDDDPDYHADVHLGRIPYSIANTVEEICTKTIAFDANTNAAYKTASLLAGAVYYYENEDYGGGSRNDGADYMEQLMDDAVLDRANAVYLYEKGGLAPCTYSCTDSLTQNNMVLYWQQRGVMYECHHGNWNIYARKLWAWDDGDSVPEAFEIQWPTCLNTGDVYQLDNDYPATTFLRSCLCGKPEVTGLGAMLLHHGSSAVISSSRISWMTHADAGGIPYHFFDHIIKDTITSHAIIGNSYDIARTEFMDISGFWIPAYHYNLFGDPALHQYGTLVGVEETEGTTQFPSFHLYPNPSFGSMMITLTSFMGKQIELDVYDECGRFVQTLFTGSVDNESKTFTTGLPTGVYFLKLTEKEHTQVKKFVIVH
jgi:hypothetical protein